MTRMPRGWRVLLALVALVVLLGAASPRKRYLNVYEAWTRELFVYWDVETALILRATYLSDEMREAIADERARLLGTSDGPEYEQRLDSDGAAYHEVVFSADSGLPSADKFGTSDDGWIIELRADGTLEPLVTAYRVRKPNPLQRALYPHYNLWSDLWIARFQRTVTSPRRVELHVGSGYGNGKVVWER